MTKGKKNISTLLASLAVSAVTCAAPRSASEQIQIFAETANSGQEGGWFVSPEKDANWNRWFYAVTDLDHDGRLEIFKAKRGGEGIAPEIRCEEFNENGGRTWGLFFAGGSDVPDIMTSEAATAPTVLYEAADNRYNYIFLETRRGGEESEFITTKYALTLRGDLQVEELAFVEEKMASPYSDMAERRFFLPGWLKVEAESGQTGTPEEIDAERYANIAQERFPNAEKSFAQISWYRAEEIQKMIGSAELPKVLENSYNAFANR